MKHLPTSGDRPRDKLWQHGVTTLGDNELLAVVIGCGCRHASALTAANEMLATSGGLHGLGRRPLDELSEIAGIGRAKAAQVAAAIELGRRTLTSAPGTRCQLRAPREAAAYLAPTFGSRPVEHFGVVLLDTRHRVVKTTVLAVGGLNAAIVEPREVFREAALGRAAAVVLFHNHPSGDASPSRDDVELTKRMAAAGALMGIEVVDHVILGDGGYCSLRELGHLEARASR